MDPRYPLEYQTINSSSLDLWWILQISLSFETFSSALSSRWSCESIEKRSGSWKANWYYVKPPGKLRSSSCVWKLSWNNKRINSKEYLWALPVSKGRTKEQREVRKFFSLRFDRTRCDISGREICCNCIFGRSTTDGGKLKLPLCKYYWKTIHDDTNGWQREMRWTVASSDCSCIIHDRICFVLSRTTIIKLNWTID